MDDKTNIIANYEITHEIPEVSRYTEFVEQFGRNMLKMGINPKFIENRYQEAIKEKKEKEGNNYKVVFYMEDEHGLKDKSTYSMNNIENMFSEFFEKNVMEKRIGIVIDDEPHYLIRQINTKEYPEFVNISDINEKAALEEMRYQWFLKLIEMKVQKEKKEMERIIALSESCLSAKQVFNSTKEIKKKMRQCKTLFINETMNGFDFREIDLSDAIFIDCKLSKANFSHCNMVNCRFVNCDLDEAIFYGAITNNCHMITGEHQTVEDNLSIRRKEQEL